MSIGITIGLQMDGPQTFDDVVDEATAARDAGFDAVWSGQTFGWEPLTTLATVGLRVPDIGLGSAVAVTYTRHPLLLASQALTTQAATGNRLILGVGVGHEVIVRGAYGYPYERPARHLREHLSALVPLLHGEAVDVEGETVRAAGAVGVAGARPPSVLVAALGPAMLRIAGELADGTIATWVGPQALADHIVPRIAAAATAAGRAAPEVLVSLPISVTTDEDAARQRVAKTFGRAEDLPAYRAVLDLQDGAGVADVTLAGDEEAVHQQLARLRDAGATGLIATPFGSPEDRTRTIALLTDPHTPLH
jgi:F420-dependent oxidoreductase-like protein